jgi:hypothetical protein
MRKIILPITLLLVAALAISACSAVPTAAPAPTGGALPSSTLSMSGTPVVPDTGSTGLPATGTVPTGGEATGAATNAATSAVTGATTGPAVTTPTAAATSAVTSQATAAATTAATSAAPAAVTGTGAPVTGATGTPFAGVPGQYVRLWILLQSNLVTGSQSGQIAGVVIAQPNPSNGASTATPSADQPVPYVRYVVVDMSGTANAAPASGTNELLLPWSMFAFNPTTSANGKVNQTFTLKGSADSRANAPQVSLPNTSGVLSPGWDSQLAQYWASQGFNIPVTGSSTQPETEVLLRQTVNGTNMVDPQNQVLGQVSDFLIDPATGQFVYAVFNGGQLFNNRYFVIPIRNLIFQLNSADASGLGNIQLNVPSSALNTAPFIDNLGLVPLDPNLLQQLNTFWQSVPK